MNREIRNSAKALIIENGKMLAIRLRDKDGIFYIMPGGGQEAEELLTETVRREVAEEVGINIECKEPLFIIEGLHGERFHRVDIVFLCEKGTDIKNAALHTDVNQEGFDWLEIASLNTLPLFPSKLRRQIMNFYQGKPYEIYLGNEQVGDPEHLE